MSRFPSATITRPMSDGRVFCLVQAERLPVERCGSCDRLEAVATDGTDSAIAILCRPTPRGFARSRRSPGPTVRRSRHGCRVRREPTR